MTHPLSFLVTRHPGHSRACATNTCAIVSGCAGRVPHADPCYEFLTQVRRTVASDSCAPHLVRRLPTSYLLLGRQVVNHAHPSPRSPAQFVGVYTCTPPSKSPPRPHDLQRCGVCLVSWSGDHARPGPCEPIVAVCVQWEDQRHHH